MTPAEADRLARTLAPVLPAGVSLRVDDDLLGSPASPVVVLRRTAPGSLLVVRDGADLLEAAAFFGFEVPRTAFGPLRAATAA